jgi:hypothetical protein
MKKALIVTFALLSVAMIPEIRQVQAATQTLDGVISDSMCGKKHMVPGKTDAQCIEECVKANSSYVLVTSNKIYTLAGKPQTIAPFAGKHVHIDGMLKDNTIMVASIHEMKS